MLRKRKKENPDYFEKNGIRRFISHISNHLNPKITAKKAAAATGTETISSKSGGRKDKKCLVTIPKTRNAAAASTGT